ncbi:hypothetical protein Lal_00008038 [Lupinus albus]|nr:hypothetical protein Lal_00008038 [Lupinus albus]
MLERQENVIQQQTKLLDGLHQSKVESSYRPSRPAVREHTAKSARESHPAKTTNDTCPSDHDISGAKHPFLKSIMSYPLPKHLTLPTNINQSNHELSLPPHFETQCPKWFTRLAQNNIGQWSTLATKFNIRFTASKQQSRSSFTLSGIRFNSEAMKVHTLSPDVATHVLIMCLRQGLFRTELAKYIDLTMEVLCSKAQQLINLEETPNNQPSTVHHTYKPSREAKRPKFHDHPRDDHTCLPRISKYTTYTVLNINRSRVISSY